MNTRVSISLFLCLSAAVSSSAAGVENELGAVALYQAVLDMGTDLRLMAVAAHPDDEDGATLAYYRMKHGLRTFAVIATRGEGGQNEIGPELYNELGVIRTGEMKAAAEVTGAELRFLDLPEFGFSKTAQETFDIWGREETVRRLVRVIREVRPDVIVTNHDTEQGHGHHRAIGTALLEAFDAAADPTRFPDVGPEPWQAARLFVRVWEETDDSVTVPINELEPTRGATYAEIAAQALERHRSQGMQPFIDLLRSGSARSHYILVREAPVAPGEVPAPGADDGDPLLAGLTDRVPPEERTLAEKAAHHGFEPGIAAALRRYAAGLVPGRDATPLARRRWERANTAAVRASEFRLVARADDPEQVPGQTAPVVVRFHDYGASDAVDVAPRIEIAPWFEARAGGPEPGAAPGETRFPLSVLDTAAPTLPAAEHLFAPHFLEPQLRVVAEVETAEGPLKVDVPLRVDVTAPVDLAFTRERYLARPGTDGTVRLELLVRNGHPGPLDATLLLAASPVLGLDETRIPLSFASEGEQRLVPVTVKVPAAAPPGDYSVSATAEGLSASRHARVRAVDVRVPSEARVGIVQSYDDTLAQTLEALGVAHDTLELEDFAPERLDRFTAVVVDIRAYWVRPDLVAHNAALLEYARRGGTVIVMYQKTLEWKSEYAPFPLRISTNRVTREDAPVEILEPDHPLFHSPNAIASEDWDGWVQERGLYFADCWAPEYTPLIRTVDPGEDIPPGSLLVAPCGDGTYVYTALVWYRQLRALHPGALRLFANLISL